MSCHVMWCHVIWRDVISCVVLCHVMQCDVMWCPLMWWASSLVKWCGAIGWDLMSYEFVMRCGWLRCHVVWFEVVVRCGELEDDLVIRSTKYCKYHTVLQGTTKYYSVLQDTAKYHSVLHSTTQYYKVQPRVTKYYKALLRTTPYYKVLLRLIVQHMKHPVQCAKQQASPSNFTKYCACHETWFWWLILVPHEMSSTMRGATGATLQPHQILRLPRKVTVMIDSRHIWNVIYNARSKICHPPTSPNIVPATKSGIATSPNIVPATKNDSHDWSPSQMKRHLQCAEQQLSSTNVTMQLLCLPRKMTRIIRDIWNVIYNARSNRTNLPTSPNMAPATKNGSPKSKRNLLKTVEASFTMRGRFDHDPNPNSSSRTRPFAEVTFRASGTHFVVKITTFRAPAIYPNFTK